MKAINKIIILGMAVALFNSCDLTLLPENAVTPENYISKQIRSGIMDQSILYLTGRARCFSRYKCR